MIMSKVELRSRHDMDGATDQEWVEWWAGTAQNTEIDLNNALIRNHEAMAEIAELKRIIWDSFFAIGKTIPHQSSTDLLSSLPHEIGKKMRAGQ